jgi:hypothetical protein
MDKYDGSARNLLVACPTCGAPYGERCTRKSGEPYSPSLSHERRKQLAAADGYREPLQPKLTSAQVKKLQDDEGPLPTDEQLKELSQAVAADAEADRQADAFMEQQMSMAGEMVKEERIKAVMWAINFARNIMNTPQAEIDMRLAIMIVESDLDFQQL